jgi:kynurenine formamidase
VSRAILLDIAAAYGRPLEAGNPVSGALLAKAARAAGVTPIRGDVVLLRTGWMEESGDDYFAGEPGLTVEGAQWLAAFDIAVVGADNYAVEVLDERPAAGFPVHELLLRDLGIPLVENVVLETLARVGVNEFLFIANPLPVRGGTAGPVAPVAVY